MAVKLKTDENLPNSATLVLRAAGHDVMTNLEESLGGAPDPRVAAVCHSEGRALITLDRGLGNIREYPPSNYSGIIVLRPHDQGVDSILAIVHKIVPLLETHSISGTLWIVGENRVRIRH